MLQGGAKNRYLIQVPPQELLEQYRNILVKDIQGVSDNLDSETFDQDVSTYLQDYEETDSMHVLIHPGYSTIEPWIDNVKGIKPSDHSFYTEELTEYLDITAEKEPVLVLYPEPSEDETRDYLGKRSDTYQFLPTKEHSAELTDSAQKGLATALTELDSSTIYLSGEVHGRCYDYTLGLLDTINTLLDEENSFQLEKTLPFPEQRVRRYPNRFALEELTAGHDIRASEKLYQDIQKEIRMEQ